MCDRQFLGSVELDAACNAGCGCSQVDYNPVCGRDNVMYYSPCYAGCSTSYAAEQKVDFALLMLCMLAFYLLACMRKSCMFVCCMLQILLLLNLEEVAPKKYTVLAACQEDCIGSTDERHK